MKFLPQNSKNKNQTKRVYLSAQFETHQDPLDQDVRFAVQDTLDRSYTETPESANTNRAETTAIQGRKAVAEMLDDESTIFSMNSVQKPAEGVNQILGLKNLLTGNLNMAGKSPEAYFWKNLIPWRAFRLWLDTKRSIWNYAEKVGPDMLKMLENSPQFYTRNDSTLMNQTALPTVAALKKGSNRPENTSLLAIDFWESSVNSMLDGFEAEHDQFDTQIKPQFGTEETWKRWVRYGLLYQQGRVSWMGNQQKNQIASARREISNNIPALRKARIDHLQGVRTKLTEYPKQAEIQLRQSAQNKIERFAAEILQNPEAFINNPQTEYVGINWRQTFTAKPIDLLEALNLEFGERVVQRATQAPKLEKDMNSTLENIDDRVTEAQTNFTAIPVEAVKNALARQGIEPAPKATTGRAQQKIERNLSTREVVRVLQNALHQTHQNIDLEADIYHTQPTRLTPEEKMALLIKYFNNNDSVLQKMEDLGAKRKLSRYILEQDEATQEPYSVGGLDEDATDSNQLLVVTSAQSLINEAQAIFDEYLPNVAEALRDENGTAIELLDQKFKNFVAHFDTLFEQIGYNFEGEQDSNKLFSKLPDQQKQILRNVAALKSVRDDLLITPFRYNEGAEDHQQGTEVLGLINLIDRSRNHYARKILGNLPPDEAAYQRDMDRYNASYNDLQRAVQEDRISPQEAAAQARGNLNQLGGFRFTADMQTRQDTLEDVMRPVFDRIQKWEKAIRDKRSFSFQMPTNRGEFFNRLFNNNTIPALEQIVQTLEAGGAALPPVPDLDERMHKLYSATMTERAETEFARRYNANMNQQWSLLQSMNVGDEISTMQFGDLTHLDGIFNLASGVTKRTSFENLQLYRKEGNRLMYETTGEGGIVVVITAPKDLSQTFSFEATEADNFTGHANCLVYQKDELQTDEDGLFTISQTNYSQAGIVLNTGSALAANYTRPPENAKRAEKGWGGWKNIAT